MAAVKGRLLVLSWAMPPLVYPRSIQISRLLKALRARGWRSTVVTILADAEPNGLKDWKLADVYNGCYRTLPVDPREDAVPSPLWLRLWRRIHAPADITSDNWLRRAEAALRAELEKSAYDFLVTFAQPWVDHLVGTRIKQRYPSLPWVAHFSDPWVDSPYLHFADGREEARSRAQERRVIQSADAVAFVTRQTADLVMAKYPTAWRRKVAIVAHCYDEEVLRLVGTPRLAADRFRIVHTGSFYPGKREPVALLNALGELAADPNLRDSLDVEFVGYATPELLALTKKLGLEGIVRFSGKCLYVDTLQATAGADLLLLMDAPAAHNVFLPSKIADYLMLKRPILGLTPPSGATADALRLLGCPMVPPDDQTAIAGWLREAHHRWNRGQRVAPAPDPEAASAFNVHAAALAFEDALESAMGSRGGLA